jgi:hypothetical protein
VKTNVKHEIGFGGKTEIKNVNGKNVTVWSPNEKV